MNTSICMANSSLLAPLHEMSGKEPMFATCHPELFIGGSKLKDGVNSLEGMGNTFEITSLYKEDSHVLVQVDRETIKTCPNAQMEISMFIIIGVGVFFVVVVSLGILYCCFCCNTHLETVNTNSEYRFCFCCKNKKWENLQARIKGKRFVPAISEMMR